jgi:DNA mismatch endonuclease (patch repair protein)
MDHVSKAVRSKIMASIRSRGNKTTEVALGKLLWATGLRGYRKHWPVDGRPDFAWPRLRVAVFVDGCFWHGCRCKYLPRSRVQFWRKKIEANQRRDRRMSQRLRRAGWNVIRVKECKVGQPWTLRRIAAAVRGARRSAGRETPSRGQLLVRAAAASL